MLMFATERYLGFPKITCLVDFSAVIVEQNNASGGDGENIAFVNGDSPICPVGFAIGEVQSPIPTSTKTETSGDVPWAKNLVPVALRKLLNMSLLSVFFIFLFPTVFGR
jgi:hypothetical protein